MTNQVQISKFKYLTKSEKLGQLLFYSSLSPEVKKAWLNLLPKMKQDDLQKFFELLKKEDSSRNKSRIRQSNEWERMKLTYETQMKMFNRK